jgi:hypothetical protein
LQEHEKLTYVGTKPPAAEQETSGLRSRKRDAEKEAEGEAPSKVRKLNKVPLPTPKKHDIWWVIHSDHKLGKEKTWIGVRQ